MQTYFAKARVGVAMGVFAFFLAVAACGARTGLNGGAASIAATSNGNFMAVPPFMPQVAGVPPQYTVDEVGDSLCGSFNGGRQGIDDGGTINQFQGIVEWEAELLGGNVRVFDRCQGGNTCADVATSLAQWARPILALGAPHNYLGISCTVNDIAFLPPDAGDRSAQIVGEIENIITIARGLGFEKIYFTPSDANIYEDPKDNTVPTHYTGTSFTAVNTAIKALVRPGVWLDAFNDIEGQGPNGVVDGGSAHIVATCGLPPLIASSYVSECWAADGQIHAAMNRDFFGAWARARTVVGMAGGDAGTDPVVFPLDPTAASSIQTDYYHQDQSLTMYGDDVWASPASPGSVFYSGSQIYGTNSAVTDLLAVFGTGTLVDAGFLPGFYSTYGQPGTVNASIAGATCAELQAAAGASINPRIDAHHKVILAGCGFVDGREGRSVNDTYGATKALFVSLASAGWAHPYVLPMVDSPKLPSGFAAAVNALIRANWRSWGGVAGFVDVGAGSGDACTGTAAGQRSICFDDKASGLLSAPDGRVHMGVEIGWYLRDGGWQ